jgi:hypothetical protein
MDAGGAAAVDVARPLLNADAALPAASGRTSGCQRGLLAASRARPPQRRRPGPDSWRTQAPPPASLPVPAVLLPHRHVQGPRRPVLPDTGRRAWHRAPHFGNGHAAPPGVPLPATREGRGGAPQGGAGRRSGAGERGGGGFSSCTILEPGQPPFAVAGGVSSKWSDPNGLISGIKDTARPWPMPCVSLLDPAASPLDS